ncbi:NAD(P)/FAD-dependent oxidoreductase [Paenibacillus sp. BR1-192]|uniref:flavin-containing monooxygenase n=1 Tax=Paenibacillus sp. BR1-192 TaxID=3032287 RepID=UPI00240E023F|nr:NAD(P)/FAD-dependent oxidoreductase [Paenibacillus sp. BR1-192]WFB60148.1 NAD(P)/FAD-dependent oxidoreductase [Paenibacillus sp. BR1-192]
MVWDVIVIGAGQAGLASGYWLQQAGMKFLMLDRGSEAGEVWKTRYDSLKLFTPRTHSALYGMTLEGEPHGFPDKDEVASYLKSYAARFRLPIQFATNVTSVRKEGGMFIVDTDRKSFHTKALIIATGPFQQTRIPAFAASVPGDVLQLHSSEYKRPSQLQEGDVLVVGGGNSGAQIAVELSGDRETYLALGQPPRYLPMALWGKGMFWWLDRLGVLSASSSSWVGRKLRGMGDPIFGYELKQAVKCGKVVLKTRAVGAGASGMRFEDGTALKVRNIVWATGFAAGYDWLHIEQALDRKKALIHTRGISPVKGLYYVGLPWQTHRGSALLAGVSRDAREIVQAIMEKRG